MATLRFLLPQGLPQGALLTLSHYGELYRPAHCMTVQREAMALRRALIRAMR